MEVYGAAKVGASKTTQIEHDGNPYDHSYMQVHEKHRSTREALESLYHL